MAERAPSPEKVRGDCGHASGQADPSAAQVQQQSADPAGTSSCFLFPPMPLPEIEQRRHQHLAQEHVQASLQSEDPTLLAELGKWHEEADKERYQPVKR